MTETTKISKMSGARTWWVDHETIMTDFPNLGSLLAFLFVFSALLLVMAIYRNFRLLQSCVNLLTMLYYSKQHSRRYGNKPFSIATYLEDIVSKHPSRVQFITVEDGVEVTLGEIESRANQVAYWGHKIASLHLRDTVALMMLNRPDFFAFWFGLAKIGVTTAFINTNVTGKALLHSVDVATKDCEKRILVIDGDLRSQISESDMKELTGTMNVHVYFWDDLLSQRIIHLPQTRLVIDDTDSDSENGGSNVNRSSARDTDSDNDRHHRNVQSRRHEIMERDPLLLIFTSGTTGLPKASKISQSRFYLATLPYRFMCNLGPTDRIYNCLPLYHSAGGMLGLAAALRSGACMVLRKKFSASSFSRDCVKFQCTSMQYIGELARYCLAAPPSDYDSSMRLNTAFGNGMRADVWERFQKRFNIKHIVEFYASTEGNIVLFNACDKPGALGYIPRIADVIYPVKLVKTDPSNRDMPYRDPKDGRCVVCGVNEVGLMIGAVDSKRVDRRFDGYTDSVATNKKNLHDVFAPNDTYFNTGDLLYRDAAGFFFWADRTGDTFRWKGENVSTTEVSNVIACATGVNDVTVCGVEVPGCDGRAGLAAITLKDNYTPETFPWDNLHRELVLHLPPFARPCFVRVQNEIAMTSTFKHQKNDLIKQGIDLKQIGKDSLYLHMPHQKTFVAMDENLYEKIRTGKIQL